MKKIAFFSFLLLIFLFFLSCSDKSSILETSNITDLEGIWSGTNTYFGKNEKITYTFKGNKYEVRKNDLLRGSGTFQTDNFFILFFDKYGALGLDGHSAVIHYSINNNILTLNKVMERGLGQGGIFEGNSNKLVNTNWKMRLSKFNSSKNEMEYFYKTYLFNSDNTCITSIVRGDVDKDTLNYSIFGNTLTIGNYISIYEIKNNKLYIYSKPGTDPGNDNYWEIELEKQ